MTPRHFACEQFALMTKGVPLPCVATSESLWELIKDLNRWTAGSANTTFKKMVQSWLKSKEAAAMPQALREKVEDFQGRTTPD
jgi:hypothetical protein